MDTVWCTCSVHYHELPPFSILPSFGGDQFLLNTYFLLSAVSGGMVIMGSGLLVGCHRCSFLLVAYTSTCAWWCCPGYWCIATSEVTLPAVKCGGGIYYCQVMHRLHSYLHPTLFPFCTFQQRCLPTSKNTLFMATTRIARISVALCTVFKTVVVHILLKCNSELKCDVHWSCPGIFASFVCRVFLV